MPLAVVGVLTLGGIAVAEPADEPSQGASAALLRIEGQLDAVEDRRRTLVDEADVADQELAALRGRLVAAASGIVGQQDELRQLEQELAALGELEQALRERLNTGREATASLLAALQRLAHRPAASLIAGRQPPLQAVRAAMLMRATVPTLEARAGRLREEMSILADLRRALAARQSEVRAARGLLDGEIDRLTELVDERQTLIARNARDRAELADASAALARRAEDLRDLLRLLEEERAASVAPSASSGVATGMAPGAPAAVDRIALGVPWSPDGGAPSATTRPMIPLPQLEGVVLPVSGDVVTAYGAPTPPGGASEGLTLRTYPGAPLVAPLDGEVRFAGDFRGYGEILILQHPGGYHSLIAGVGRIDASVGQQVLIGEPIGAARLPQPGDSQPLTIYYELRRHGRPVDPIQGLARAQMRGRG